MNILIRLVVVALILLLAYGVRLKLIASKPEPKSQKITEVVPLVDIIEVSREKHLPDIKSFGTVRSFFETTLSSEVEGKIISVSPSFKVGELVPAGEILVTIDSADFETEYTTAKADLVLMQSALDEEQVRQKQAKDDWLASGRRLETASDFVLRKPQMAAAEAGVTSAQAAVDRASLQLERTKIRAPYAAVVTERSASLGNFSNSQISLGTLVATEKAEVRIPLTPEQMQRVAFSNANKPKVILKDPNNDHLEWSAQLTNIEPTVDAQNQVSYGIATVEQPYTNETGVLPIGTFVSVTLPCAGEINSYKIPESALVNDRHIWLLDSENKLIRADGKRLINEGAISYVEIDSGELKSPLRIVSRPLSNFRTGSLVKTADEVAK